MRAAGATSTRRTVMPLIDMPRIAAPAARASSALAARRTAPALPRPPTRTCALMTTSSAPSALRETAASPAPAAGVAEPIRANRVALKGQLTTPIGSGFRSVNVALRKALDLYANLRPARSLVGGPATWVGGEVGHDCWKN